MEAVGRVWARAARPWYPVRGRAFVSRSSNWNGIVPVTADLETELAEMIASAHRDLRIWLLNRVVDRVLEERRHRQATIADAVQAAAQRGDLP